MNEDILIGVFFLVGMIVGGLVSLTGVVVGIALWCAAH